ncbi:tRNA A-37 threonylcarbamoyl transferase component Bud32 [Amycolatopsis bartoniae]|uniref:serine/threonine-protein kinase n=1 Tax=Amycolatopsis bartoniae TaxID=941986 RepID=UPI00118F3BC4|nr:serine/threonine-protein kinase [Amycolatopsis bartoniae]MBB2937400.1 tRNA A-37 threonylcarbamoyl transferase component Bud32 [Amycolatopsis bartoniae]TVS99530.1 serine/threonine protein kinase [Amycolatopsis bartoniae]
MPTDNEEPRVVAGRYRLRSVLGSGSMGTVWSAYDEFLQRPVAVKEIRLPPGVTAGQADELRERTLREARAIAVLSHPNVIVLHDVARQDGEPFVVMELLPSHSLADLIREHGPLTVEQAAAVGDAVAAALEAAHAAGITHRDVKPGNVLVADDGRIKLTDFGIARNVSEATMTRTGMTLGSPAYIAPEIASGKAVTPGADLWGLGATLYNALEGHPPYDADGDPLETIGKVVRGEVPKPSPGPLAPVITGLMAKEPQDRLSLHQVRQQLYPLLTKAPRVLFGPEMFQQATGRRLEATDTREMAPAPKPEEKPAEKPAEASQELAVDPGPLPFAPTAAPAAFPAQPRGRSTRATVALVGVAVLLFLVCAAGGFMAARVIGAEPITPPSREQTSATVEPPPTQFERRTGDASNARGQEATFSVEVPSDWTKFTSAGVGDDLPASTLVEWVSPDGSQMLAVDHIAGYFPNYTIDQYTQALSANRGTDFTPVASSRLADRDGVAMTYRTFDKGSSGSPAQISRTTFVEVFRHNTSLWAVSVTVPTEQEVSAKSELYERIVPTFTITG